MAIVEDVDRFRFSEPGPFQAGELEVTPEDLIANLPYREGCAMWFDHHATNQMDAEFRGSWWIAPSAARVIYEFYSNGNLEEYEELIKITDKIDSARLTMDEIKDPAGYILISMTIEGKRPQDESYWLRLIKLTQKNDLNLLLKDPEVIRRCNEYESINNEFRNALKYHSKLDGNVLVTDFRDKWHGEPGNRFLAYTLYPSCDIWVKAADHPNDPARSHISVGHSIFNRTSPVHVGNMLANYGGGGHQGAGSCRPMKSDSDRMLKEIIEVCRHD